MQFYPFDSRNNLYRDKIGALAEGETLRLRLLLHNDAKVYSAFLRYKEDNDENFKEILLKQNGNHYDYKVYETEIELCEGLYWYHFRYESEFGEFYVTKTDTSLGVVSKDGGSWQQTVYSNSFKTPDWLAGGIIYQIFPDRFYKSGEAKENIPADRFINNDWYKTPEHRYVKGEKKVLGNDYYGGDLKGIAEKLDYLKDLGVNCIYLNPIFEAHSNHRYNTADYFKIDSLLGNEKDLKNLVKEAKKRGIYIILDGVFSHTGDDSIYFNRYGRYNSLGAYQSPDSEYFSWFKFENYPEKYKSWWGIDTLPETIEDDESFSEFITGEKGVLKYWLKKGVMGWRLDVADELPDNFLEKIRTAIKTEGEDNFLLGEVWEDASNKISYGERRKFLRGKELDSVMNYPFADAIIDYLKSKNPDNFINTVSSICENYPPQTVKLLMNHIGTHDTPRILTRLATDCRFDGDRESQSKFNLNEAEYKKGISLLKLAAVLQYTLPGVPSLYYGDEAGMQGFGDPFCRAGYPWGRENTELLEFYKALGKLRREGKVFKDGELISIKSVNGALVFMRKSGENISITAVNPTEKQVEISLDFNEFDMSFGEKPQNYKLVLNQNEYSILIHNVI
ncbi:MAG: glycoside hydrolase family 13 protein [Clostridia bacterium]|nr:glycoside hydrolase family 13 protein [Clostridia bacterium]